MALLRPLMFLLVLLIAPSAFAADGVNAVLGDESYVARFGTAPGAGADEDLRLRVHLEYVEARLRAADTGGLSPAQRAARARNLDLLHAYHRRGEFPRNHAMAGRRPHFIDEDGRICAVGYLIEQTAGRELAEAINAEHEWSFLPEITGIDAWVAASGLSLHELAMIQPSYGFMPRPAPRPMPEEGELRRRMVMRLLGQTGTSVQACADQYGMAWRLAEVRVAVTLRLHAVQVEVRRVGGRGFRACVKRAVESRVAGQYFRGRVQPLTIDYAFAIERDRDDEDPYLIGWGQQFARPPR